MLKARAPDGKIMQCGLQVSKTQEIQLPALHDNATVVNELRRTRAPANDGLIFYTGEHKNAWRV
jgi:hypothetical protein